MLINGNVELNQIKSSILSHISTLFEISNLKITVLGYAADLKV